MSEWIISMEQLAILYAKLGHRMRDQDGNVVRFDLNAVDKEIRLDELVRCRDCKHNLNGACEHWDYCDIYDHENGYCAWGERRPGCNVR